MFLRNVHIQTKDRTTYTLSGPVTLKVAGGLSANDAYVDGVRTVSLSQTALRNLFNEAVESIEQTYRYISSINGIGPGDDGDFWIGNDACMSWAVPEDEYVDTYATTYNRNNSTITYYNREQGQGINIYDTCPACQTCDAILELKRRAEQCKIILNRLKDLNIYRTSICNLRTEALRDAEIEIPINCAAVQNGLNDKQLDRVLQLPSVELLSQYVAMVHMWNYVVGQNNASTEIDVMPGENTAFYIRTKRAVTSCGEQTSVICTIQVSGQGVYGDGNINLYVDGPYMDKEPFASTDSIAQASTNGSGMTAATTVVFPKASVVGTYRITLNVHPFRGYIGTRSDGSALVYNTTAWTPKSEVSVKEDQKTRTTTTKLLTGASFRPAVIQGLASRSEFINYRSFPSQSVSGHIIWTITITWTITGMITTDGQTQAKTFQNTYIFETPRPNELIDGAYRDHTFVKVEYLDED